MTIIMRALRGEERLWKVWWLGGLGFTIANLMWLKYVVRPGAIWSSDEGTRNTIVALYLMVVVASIALQFASWQCAFNVRWRGWGWIVRASIVIVTPIGLMANGYFVYMVENAPAVLASSLSKEGNSSQPEIANDTSDSGSSRTTNAVAGSEPASADSGPTPPGVPTSPPRHLDDRWHRVPPKQTEAPGRIYAVYAGRKEKAEIGTVQWSGSVADFGPRMVARLTGFHKNGLLDEGTLLGQRVWGVPMAGSIDGVPYAAEFYAFHDASGHLCWIFAVSALPNDRGFEDRAWRLAEATYYGEYPR
ncbi:hypothetical protein [Burkholderia sp. Bp9143]|uniref:hypothetical protein n=1 Tax=Burkholderia sp. Bp9143 TaxID=2184574 RepID=UPI000F5A2743|nr:hypothetical protein [Burkholderia sp. Bp9143]